MNSSDVNVRQTDIATQKLSLLYKQSRASAALNIIIACILAAILYGHLPSLMLMIWLSCMTLIAFVRVGISIAFFKKQPEPQQINQWQQYYFISLIVIASIWGFGGAAMVSQLSFAFQSIVYFFLMGMGGGFLVAHSVHRLHINTFMPILFLPSILTGFILGDWHLVLVGIGTCIFMFAGMNASRILTKMLHQNFLLTQELHDAKIEAEQLANIDALTGLNNRRAFMALSKQQVSLSQRTQTPITLIMADVDNFKAINDNYGHDAGDKALIFIAEMINGQRRSSDICARLGGEEFVILLPDTEGSDALHCAEKIRQSIEENPFIIGGSKLTLSVSMGMASNIYDVDKLMSHADKAMYQAKQQGKNRVVAMSESA